MAFIRIRSRFHWSALYALSMVHKGCNTQRQIPYCRITSRFLTAPNRMDNMDQHSPANPRPN